MTASTSTFPGTEFDAFLFAPVIEEKEGVTLSVVSMLARLGMDPWKEAASLTGMPVGVATQRLASFIATLPGLRSDSGAVAARLTALLPQKISDVQTTKLLRALKAAPKLRARKYLNINTYILVLGFAAIILLAIGH